MIDHSDAVGWPARPTQVYRDTTCSRLSAEFTSAREYRRIRTQQKQRAQRTWLAKPGSLEKKRAAQRAWKAAQRER